jgi:integrase
VRIYLGRDPDTGQQRFHRKTFAKKRQAEQYERKHKGEHFETGVLVEPSKTPLKKRLEKWLDGTARMRVRARTLADYRGLVDRYIVPKLGDVKLARLHTSLIDSMYADMLDAGLSPRTVRFTHSVLHSALDRAVELGLLRTNPAKKAALPEEDKHREMRAMTPEQAEAFLAAAKGSRWEALWTLLLSTGLRPGEALGLKWSDVEADRLHVRRGLVRRKREWSFEQPKTRAGIRQVAIPPVVARALQSQRAAQARERLKAGEHYEDHDLVFANQAGGPLDWRVVAARHFRPLLKKAELSGFRPYDLRHTHATLLLREGVNVKVVSRWVTRTWASRWASTRTRCPTCRRRRRTRRSGCSVRERSRDGAG